MPVRQRDDDHRKHRHENKNLKCGRDLADHLNAAHVDPRQQGDQRDRDEVMLPPRHFGEVVGQVVGEQHGVDAAQQKRSRPVPPAGKKSPEVAKGGARPAIEAALDRHGSGQFRRNQRHRDAPEEWQDQEVDQRQPRPRGSDHILEAEGATRSVGEHYEDEIEETGFAECGGLVVGGQSGFVGYREFLIVD